MFGGQTTGDNYQPAVPLLRPGAVMDRAQSPQTQRSELNVSFDNAPPECALRHLPEVRHRGFLMMWDTVALAEIVNPSVMFSVTRQSGFSTP